ncbi:MAG: hypothetical protein ACK5L5_08220 [Bacteroidales bacterium]
MNRNILLVLLVAIITVSCANEGINIPEREPLGDYNVVYDISSAVQNIDGELINLKFETTDFDGMSIKLSYKSGELETVTYSNGSCPFNPTVSGVDLVGDVDCIFDDSSDVATLKVKGTNEVIAYFQDQQFKMPFQLGCSAVSYELLFDYASTEMLD